MTESYSSLKSQLQNLQVAVQALLDLEQAQTIAPDLNRSQEAIQGFFQVEILESLAIPAETKHLLLPYYVETNKQLRLLRMDLNMLQAARSDATFRIRVQQTSDRLQTLIGYCDYFMQLV